MFGCVVDNQGTSASGAHESTEDGLDASEGTAGTAGTAESGDATGGGSTQETSTSGSSVGSDATTGTSVATSGDSEDVEITGVSSSTSTGEMGGTQEGGETEGAGDEALAECRGVVAVRSGSGNYIGWRAKATDPEALAWNVYRDTTLLNAEPLAGGTNFLDEGAPAGSAYHVRPVLDGEEQGSSETVMASANPYIAIPLDNGGGRQAGRMVGVGDLDGDCRYDLVLKRSDGDRDVTQSDPFPSETIKIEAYADDGRFLWRRDVGPNIRPGVWFSPFVVFDLDGDGRAEVILKASEVPEELGGNGDVNGDGRTDYRESNGDMYWNEHRDVEFVEVWSGETGEFLARAPWIDVGPWGSDGNRYNRNQMGVAYLDGERPSVVFTRGGNSRNEVHAYDYRDGELTRRWAWVAENGGGNYGHNVRAGDVDGDGRDEFLFFNVAIDDDGSRVLWNTQEQHGDRFHMSDIDPDRPGMEIFYIQEFGGSYTHPVSLRDAATGEVIWGPEGNWDDVGRGLSANIDAEVRGMESWASAGELYDARGEVIGERPNTPNMAIWWDADREREIIDGTTISDWNGRGFSTVQSANGCSSGSRNIPMAVADILGDWREEAIWVCNDTTELRIYVNTEVTTFRLPTFMQDPEYRTGVATMTSGYVQSAHTSFYVGSDMDPPPAPRIVIPAGT